MPRPTSGSGTSRAPITIQNERIAKLLQSVLEGADSRDFFDALIRVSGTPGPRPNLELARAAGAEIARAGKAGLALTEELLENKNGYLVRVGLMALAERASDPRDKTGAFETLHDRADEIEKESRDAVIDALASVVVGRGDDVLPQFASMTDGFLHAFVALEALTVRTSLDRISHADELLARLSEAFDLADQSSRAAERAQGVRLLRQSLPDQIARIALRFPEAIAWVEEHLTYERPETRDVMKEALAALRKRSLGDADIVRLTALFEDHAPKPRDPSRIVKGTRRRGRLR
jgi:hypothetical protein